MSGYDNDMTVNGSENPGTDSGPLIYVGATDLKRGLMRYEVFKPPLPEWLAKIRDEDSSVREKIITAREFVGRWE